MGIERNNRSPKRRRTTAQRMKGRLKPVFELPEAGPSPAKPKAAKAEKPKAAPKAKPAAKKTVKKSEA